MCLDGKINQASHLIGASTFFVCVISRRCHLHAAPARVDGTIFVDRSTKMVLSQWFQDFCSDLHGIISNMGGCQGQVGMRRSPGPHFCRPLIYVLARTTRHQRRKVSVGVSQNCWENWKGAAVFKRVDPWTLLRLGELPSSKVTLKQSTPFSL